MSSYQHWVFCDSFNGMHLPGRDGVAWLPLPVGKPPFTCLHCLDTKYGDGGGEAAADGKAH